MTASRIAARVHRIKPSPSSAASDRANELRRQGQSIINLVVGEPDFDTPAHIRHAANAAIERGETRYTQNAGTPQLRQAIVDKLARENGLAYTANQVLVTSGAKSAIFNAFAATLGAGDEVLIPAPYWVSYPDMVLACEGEPVVLACLEEHAFKLTPDQLRAAITERTRWLLLNSPSNPTGASYNAAELRALADVLLDFPHVLLMTDDIYEHIRYEGLENPHILAIEPALGERSVVVNGVSKTYAMTGWRIGYAAGPADLIGAMATLQSQSTSNACSISQAAAVEALNGDQSFVQASVEVYQQRRDRCLGLLNAIDGLSCRKPDGAFYLYVNCSGLLGRSTPEGKRLDSDYDVVMYLLESQGVAVVAGTAYGLAPFFRMSIATDITTLDEGCSRIAAAVAALR
ncbi:aspartate aminotransferase [Pseudomonas fluorescens]|uniref:Aminotransferase n=2 Tax=Pseudomonas TaxID=286 RepID=A0A5M9J2A3_9PSED|nr:MULTISPECIES: aspartate transaminase [Pseudomonas]AOE67360.1 aspartate aminotransferase [Pseudomonas fluorescens]AOE73173.1 aspartate aminotransferase [Pseudomonas fluorescens]KAA8562289.1 Aspartate aminotransferase [Pseudomonas extremaustralis]PMX23382.1 pyridoxal phosphate-dependent aminotransferase [Pseudomonas sp. GW460-12]PMX32267.1 pyridoxal phosphate-dependent aminotransferase [Pseudomonas sp. MPR-R2A4]